jgi:hypothetical protein
LAVPTGQADLSIPGILTSDLASGCILDWPRTHSFTHAIDDAVRKLERRIPEGEIFFVDAGTGPHAFLSVVAALQSERMRGIAIEANSESARQAEATIRRLGLDDRISVVQADARQFVADRPIDLFLTETFDSGLWAEQGAQLLSHFSTQKSDVGIMIPSGVEVQAALVKSYLDVYLPSTRWTTVYRADYERERFDTGSAIVHAHPRPGRYQLFVSTRLLMGSDFTSIDRFSGSAITEPVAAKRIHVNEPGKNVLVTIKPGTEDIEVAVVPAGA